MDSLIKQGALKVDFLLAMWNIPTEHLHIPIAANDYAESLAQAIKENAAKPKL